MSKTKHLLGLSGGKDSAALAVHMNNKYSDLDTIISSMWNIYKN